MTDGRSVQFTCGVGGPFLSTVARLFLAIAMNVNADRESTQWRPSASKKAPRSMIRSTMPSPCHREETPASLFGSASNLCLSTVEMHGITSSNTISKCASVKTTSRVPHPCLGTRRARRIGELGYIERGCRGTSTPASVGDRLGVDNFVGGE
ncbi:hypothetical protein BS47DRAFT_1361949 [Hydnum rufescens UP504]|uniref:Uncharacterized protein n=1 Tax=Hydnum rufescens UP504 TaxID=1448309 RepID=A0A9P6AYE3_9AGAM|nr:hypothetical protein BS47DRAFT_1361949 [Hydnum rufescens UP504]